MNVLKVLKKIRVDSMTLSVQKIMIVAKNKTRVLIMLIFARRNGAVMTALADNTDDDVVGVV